jgi:thiamine pyrophosphate-dependent acetolactate synthase large subunit-like protein
LGAKLAKPDKQVIVVHGDGSFGLNAMELDTAVRLKIPVLVVISLNGGWTADPKRDKPGRDLGYTRFDKMAETLGCYGEYVDKAENIRPALERAQKKVTTAASRSSTCGPTTARRATTTQFAQYST